MQHRQQRIFVIAGVSFGQVAHDKDAAFGAVDDFGVPAGGAESNQGRDWHREEFSMKAECCQRCIDDLLILGL